MMVDRKLRTSDVARACQVSVQQVRNYESSGLIPRAGRSASGYRHYTGAHLAAVTAAQLLVAAYGWPRARQIMEAVHGGTLEVALALIDERHAELTARREQLAQTLAALRTLAAQSASADGARGGRRVRVGEAASAAGVRVSAVHFWEQQGLLQPTRDSSSGYRMYDEQQLRRLRVVALLREAGYDFGAIRLALDELAAGQTGRAVAAVEQRHATLAAASWACCRALAVFQAYVTQYWPEQPALGPLT